MATTGRLAFAKRPEEVKEQTPTPVTQPAWIQELIERRSGGDPRKKRTPVGFDFQREPFDPSSYYKSIGLYRDISRAATRVTQQEVANREEARMQREFEENQRRMQGAMGGVNPNFEYSDGGGGGWSATHGRKYKLGGVSKNTNNAASYFGNKYGIKTVGGYRSHGSVPGSDHPKGLALDYMTNNIKNGKKVGDALANDLIKNWKKWNVKYVIWYRYIWSPGKGWRRYNGPSPHTDHVHASFNK